jgi:hypothetical protein
MATSDRFYRYMKNLHKKSRELDDDAIRGEIERAFHTCMNTFPESMRVDLFEYFSDPAAGEGSDREAIFASADRLQRVVELFEENYEVGDDEFSDADWDAVKQAVDDHAVDLDTDLITYVMRFVVKRGLLG